MRQVWNTIAQFHMLEPGDRVLLGVSGGPDSVALLHLLHSKAEEYGITLHVVHVNHQLRAEADGEESFVRALAEQYNVPFRSYCVDVAAYAKEQKLSLEQAGHVVRFQCFLDAKEHWDINKLALGHHYDDVIETTMMNLLCAGNFKTMLPKLHSTNFDGIQIIRPLYFIREEHIIRFIQHSGIWPLNCACMVAAKKTGNKRYEIKDLIKSLEPNFKDVEKSIFKAAENVNIDSVLGWQQDGEKHSFLERFE